ncbi:MAG: PP2C family serine/threonine-protein phosphatase [Pseudomonadota bacterium]
MDDEAGIGLDVSSALALGARTRQEDALVTSFAQGADVGFAVLSDGMGGHAAGDLASRIIVTEMFAELTLRTATGQLGDDDYPTLLRYAAEVANECLATHISANPSTRGMGGTVVVTLVVGNDLYWLSIGDSPLWLWRDGELTRLNEDHSMAPQIDMMVAQGLMDAETARNHPQRSCLTSAIIGENLAAIDCPTEPFELRPNDVVLAASDGLQYLPEAGISAILKRGARSESRALADALIDGISSVGDPEQDNTSVVVIRAEPLPSSQKQTTSDFSVGQMLKTILRNVAPARHAGTEGP